MAMFGRREKKPVDRAVEELERQLAQVRREIRAASRAETPPAATAADPAAGFTRQILAPARLTVASTYRARRPNLFDDGSGDALKELDAAPVEFRKRADPDLFTPPQPAAMADVPGTVSLGSPPQEKLVHYLSAGALRGQQRPLRHVRRKERNRFFAWLGLAMAALWLLYVVAR
jgi:hypothetical protein